MRYDDEEDPKKPHPVGTTRKGDGRYESQEYGLRQVNPDEHRDDHCHVHHHVHRC
ncbi:MAG TPA: hypothetical protein VK427_07560 [Kofleriaceae bacterium]|nr:hypothetical protein [Kofleriaceae bacterium]